MNTEPDRIFIDTNVLVYSTFVDFEPDKHRECLTTFSKLEKAGKSLFVSAQVLREFYAIVTNERIFPKPLTSKQALRKIKEFL